MRTDEFRRWLQYIHVTKNASAMGEKTISSRVSNCVNVERHEGNLDEHAAKDRLDGLLSLLTYSTDDQRRGQPLGHRVPIDGDFRTGSATLKAAINLYRQFWEDWPPGSPPPNSHGRTVGPERPEPPGVAGGTWPTWSQPSDAEALTLAKIVMPYVRFLNPEIVASIVADNERQRQEWSAAFKVRRVNLDAYLWDRSSCAFPGVRRYAGSLEIAIVRGHVKGSGAKFEQALDLDDNDYPKHLWSFIFRGKHFQKYGPHGYSLAHLADHKKHGNRFASDLEVVDGVARTELHGLYSCPTNTVYIPNSMIKPTDFGGAMRNLLLRRAERLYGTHCNLFPEWLRIPPAQSDEWNLDKFSWAKPVGDKIGVDAFLDYRNEKLRNLLGQAR